MLCLCLFITSPWGPWNLWTCRVWFKYSNPQCRLQNHEFWNIQTLVTFCKDWYLWKNNKQTCQDWVVYMCVSWDRCFSTDCFNRKVIEITSICADESRHALIMHILHETVQNDGGLANFANILEDHKNWSAHLLGSFHVQHRFYHLRMLQRWATFQWHGSPSANQIEVRRSDYS